MPYNAHTGRSAVFQDDPGPEPSVPEREFVRGDFAESEHDPVDKGNEEMVENAVKYRAEYRRVGRRRCGDDGECVSSGGGETVGRGDWRRGGAGLVSGRRLVVWLKF